MGNNLKRAFFVISCLCCLLYSSPIKADIVFPARLELREVKPGVFDVVFVLPVVKGKVLKATPLLPDSCTPLGEPFIDGNENTKRQTWQMSCKSVVLNGQRIGIDGLQGSQVDILLNVNMLDGRVYNTMLSSINPFYVVPPAPSYWTLFKQAGLKGMQIPLSIGAIFILLLTLLPFKLKKKTILFSGIAFAIAICLAHGLALENYMKVLSYIPTIITYLISALLAFYLITQRPFPFKSASVVMVAVLLGFGFGASTLGTEVPLIYSNQETTVYQLLLLIGVFIGVALALAVTWTFLDVLNLIFSKQKTSKLNYTLATILGTLAIGLLLYESSVFWVAPSLMPSIPILIIAYVKLLAGWLAWSKTGTLNLRLFIFALPLALGLIIGFYLEESVWTLALVVASSLYMCIQFCFNAIKNNTVNQVIFAGSSLIAGIHVSSFASEHLSYAVAQTSGFFIVLALIFSVVFSIVSAVSKRNFSAKSYPIFGGLLISYILFQYSHVFTEVFIPSVKNGIASGLLKLPLLSICLLIIAFFLWPRYKKVHKAMNLERKKPVTSFAMLGLALCALPITFAVASPWYVPHAPGKQDMKRIMTQVLLDTYTAFNNTDEDQLFDDLSETVDDDLIDDMYLDSRRLLSTGLREGAEVKVQQVTVENVNDFVEGSQSDTTFEYPTEWIVTARVKHLQHIHYRQNRYKGHITMRNEGTAWKIAGITLTSEDRTVIASSNP